MIICFDCPSDIKRSLDLLISKSGYSDYSEAIISAVQNLLIIQGEVKKKGIAFLGNDVGVDEHRIVGQSADIPAFYKRDSSSIEEKESHEVTNTVTKRKSDIPALFSIDNLDCDLSEIPEYKATLSEEFKEYPVNHWIFGMYNRLLPAKANCRALAKLITERGGHGIPIKDQVEKVAYKIAEEAALLGNYLKKHDGNFNLKRDEGLSTAFPGSAPRDEKSRLRYANQFVARIDTSKNVSGLLFDLRLIEKINSDNPSIRLTKPGWEFALQKNPVFENLQDNPRDKFLDQEVDFLINHICDKVPVEASAYFSIMNILSSGNKAPNEIDEALMNLYKSDEIIDEEKKLARIATQRSGVTSRMIDLKIILRKRSGTKLTYSMTKRGHELLTHLSHKFSQNQEGII